MLEVGPGTGYYTLDVAEWVGPDGAVDILDIQQEMLDHTMRRARRARARQHHPDPGDATALPYEDGTFDAAYLVTVLGEIPDQDAALRELARVLKPGGRLVVGELLGDPHYVARARCGSVPPPPGSPSSNASGNALGYFARFSKP